MANTDKKGTIDLSNFTTTAYLPAKGGVLKQFNGFKISEKVLLQLGSSDLSGAVTATLQVSVDGDYWATAQEDGTDVTFSVSTTTPVCEIINGANELLWRVAVTIDGKTGTIDYSIKDVDL